MTIKQFTVKEVAEGAQLPAPKYKDQPYIVLGSERTVLFAGTLQEIKDLRVKFGDYYDECEVNLREHDLYMNNNTRIDEPDPLPPLQPTTIEEIARHYPQVKELLEAYENCLTQIGENRQSIHDMNQIMTGMQQTINGLILEVESLRPMLEKGAEMRKAQKSYYALRKQSQSRNLNDAQRVLLEQQAREWLVTSKIIEKDFDDLVTKATELRNQTPPEPDQPELL